jgi:hypothetical protein
VLCDSDYQRFTVGVSSIYGLLNRLDRLVSVTKDVRQPDWRLPSFD